jgi:hypothetical protein
LGKGWLKFTGRCPYRNSEFRASGDRNYGKDVLWCPKFWAALVVILYLPYGLELNPEVKYIGKNYQGGDDSMYWKRLTTTRVYNLIPLLQTDH